MYFILGASGSGKTTVLTQLDLPTYQLFDFDDIGVPAQADTQWRQEATERWIAQVSAQGDDAVVCLFGQMVLGEILACRSAKQLKQIQVCFLDCDDQTRVQRLKNSAHKPVNQSTLNWAAWLRMHHHDPRWQQHVIKERASALLDFSSWDQEASWDGLADVSFLDTSLLSSQEVSAHITEWITRNQQHSDIIFTHAQSHDLQAIIDLLLADTLIAPQEPAASDPLAYQRAFERITQDPNAYLLVAKQHNQVIGVTQINFIPNLTYQGGSRALIEGVRIDARFRNKGLGTQLIHKAIALARVRGCVLVQLTTDKRRDDALRFYERLGFINSHHGLKLKI